MKTLFVFFALALAGSAAAKPATNWTVVQDRGVWWLQGPDGKKILSRGVDCTGPGPTGKDFNPKNPAYSPELRGGESYGRWESRTVGRLQGWGFNTAAGWSDARLGKAGMLLTPVLHIGVQLGMPWWDPWAEDLPRKARDLAAALVAPTKGQPGRVGYFLDNEFGWGDDYIMGLALNWPATQPGKRKLLETLQRVYAGDFRKFLEDFETSATSWDGFLSSTTTGNRPGRGHRAEDAVVYEIVHRYDEVIAGAVRAADPGALILGDRYRQYYPQAVARAARGVLDAVSTNFETTADGWVSPAYFLSLHELSGLPVIVGEYYGTARQNRTGNRNSGGYFTLVDTQAQRAAVVAAQARQFAGWPFVVGWHWFQWMDEPPHGRDDGEDYNMGLVDLYDVPYAEITGDLTAVNGEADRLHAAGLAALVRLRGDGFAGPLAVARQGGLVADGKLEDWDKSAPLPRTVLLCDAPLRPFGDVFLAWDAGSLRVAVRAFDFSLPAKNTPYAADPATWGDFHRLRLVVDGVTVYAGAGLTAAAGASEDSWKTRVYAVPPARGGQAAAVAATVDRWKYTWEVAVPAAALAPGSLAAGQRHQVSLVIENRGDFEAMHVDGLDIVLGDPAPVR